MNFFSKTTLLFFFTSFFFSTHVNSQSDKRNIIKHTRERSATMFGSGYGDLDTVYLESKFLGYTYWMPEKNKTWAADLYGGFNGRLMDDESSPIPSPSFYAGATFFKFLESAERESKFISLNFQHHSNGKKVSYSEITSNTRSQDVSFGINVFTLGFNQSSAKQIGKNSWSFYRKYWVSYNLEVFEDEVFSELYSDLRTGISLQLFKNPTGENGTRMHFFLDAGILIDDMNEERFKDGRAMQLSLTYAIQPVRTIGVALFTRLYYGEDYYNNSFTESIKSARVGLMFYPNFD